MFNQLSYYIFSILILLIFTTASVYSVTCDYSEQTCYRYPDTWCCPSYQICGRYSGSCYHPVISTSTLSPKPSSSFSSAFLAVIILFPTICLILCVYTMIRSQQRPSSSVATLNHQRVRDSHGQYPIQRPGRILHGRPVRSVSPAPSNFGLYEAPPPSYEAATNDLPPKYESAPVIAMVERTNL